MAKTTDALKILNRMIGDDTDMRQMIAEETLKAQAYSIEASNSCHEHEWRVWEEVKLPEGKGLIPGVVDHCNDFLRAP